MQAGTYINADDVIEIRDDGKAYPILEKGTTRFIAGVGWRVWNGRDWKPVPDDQHLITHQ